MSENTQISPEQNVSDLDSSANWSVKYLSPSGFECLLTLEAASGTDVLMKAQRALERLLESQCVPITHYAATPSVQGSDKDVASLCPIHHVDMKLWKKNDRSWYAHKVDGNWCRGR
ncbi:MAG: hypothetical protein AB9897_03445 [Anaerolineaceae bacterium]